MSFHDPFLTIERVAQQVEQFGIDHAHAGALYAQNCGADAELCASIAYHHGGRSGVRVPSPLAACVQVAEALAGVLAGAPPDWALTDEALAALALDRAMLDEIARTAATGQPTVTDVPSGLSAQVAELERLAHSDDLTGVLSRRAWIEHARQQLHAHRAGTLLLCDVDDFKHVNDTFGHPAGDALLTQLAEILAQHGTAGRLGGDEFALWIHDPLSPPVQIADTILAQTATAFAWTRAADQPASTGISIGIANTPADAHDLATLLELADAALYQAKRAGGRRARVARPHCAEKPPENSAPRPHPGQPGGPTETRPIKTATRGPPDRRRLAMRRAAAFALDRPAEPDSANLAHQIRSADRAHAASGERRSNS